VQQDKFIIEGQFWILSQPVGVPVYDFDFRRFFDCRTPYDPPLALPGVARIGAFDDYQAFHAKCADCGVELVHSPDDYHRCTSLPIWYPLIEAFTPRSRWYSEVPTLSRIEEDFSLPIFVKGSRQTSKHKAAASVIRTREDFETATDLFRSDPILRWQEFVCRELLDLRPISGGAEGKIDASFEFRTFWWRGELVGSGRYWFEADDYTWTETEKAAALAIARHAVEALGCTFLVVDLAQTSEGDWIVIECNDGMESGYAGASPFAIWQNIVEYEKQR
jgi:hypothetical protein